jgi:RNA polymerase sigma-70 factor (ECF subfamily)
MKERNDLSDEALTERARGGDREAFEVLCERYLPVVYNRLRAKLPPEAVEDVTQGAFVAATRGIRHFRGNASFRTWILAIARHKVADYYRRRERRPETVQFNPLIDHGDSEGHGWEERAMVRMALERQPAHYQEILLLRFAEGLPFKEVAAELGISLEAAKSRYRRAVASVAEEMGVER